MIGVRCYGFQVSHTRALPNTNCKHFDSHEPQLSSRQGDVISRRPIRDEDDGLLPTAAHEYPALDQTQRSACVGSAPGEPDATDGVHYALRAPVAVHAKGHVYARRVRDNADSRVRLADLERRGHPFDEALDASRIPPSIASGAVDEED